MHHSGAPVFRGNVEDIQAQIVRKTLASKSLKCLSFTGLIMRMERTGCPYHLLYILYCGLGCSETEPCHDSTVNEERIHSILNTSPMHGTMHTHIHA